MFEIRAYYTLKTIRFSSPNLSLTFLPPLSTPLAHTTSLTCVLPLPTLPPTPVGRRSLLLICCRELARLPSMRLSAAPTG
jgi:hypothetical protein